MFGRKVAVPLVGALAAGLVLIGLGLFLGPKLPWGEKTARTVEGTAFLDDAQSGLAGFQGGGVGTAAFDASGIWWMDESRSGTGDPPCLKEGQEVPVEAGVMWISHPGGGAHQQVVWLRCLSGR
jgi:hypothetical protein